MKQYQAVIVRLQGKSREDEDAITDLLNERARMGWLDHSVHPLPGGRVLVIFSRKT
jgi:hypothetical protein